MGDDEGEYVESFVQGDDAALMAAVQQRDAAVAPLLKPGSSNPLKALQLALADPPYQTRTDSVKVRAPPPAAVNCRAHQSAAAPLHLFSFAPAIHAHLSRTRLSYFSPLAERVV